ncbi:MAG: plasmid pRiA4b ORF-3 family protein [Acidimicrobiaceae bacterium]|nr:plasmid pRiA4b ORF-3 family protein [Acidimicrobiaceae bacterium]
MSDGAAPTVHRLRVTLLDVTPPVWRELRVPSSAPLSVLHAILQVAFGWADSHLHEWEVGEVTYGMPDEESWGEEFEDESETTLGEVGEPDSSFLYRYDFGDGWEHLVEVLAVEPYDPSVPPIACLGGARAAPPDDSGGPFGYEHLLDALADPDDPEHDEMTAWVGDGFDPEHFDRAEVDQKLEALWRVA